jgi:hypothetical protein
MFSRPSTRVLFSCLFFDQVVDIGFSNSVMGCETSVLEMSLLLKLTPSSVSLYVVGKQARWRCMLLCPGKIHVSSWIVGQAHGRNRKHRGRSSTVVWPLSCTTVLRGMTFHLGINRTGNITLSWYLRFATMPPVCIHQQLKNKPLYLRFREEDRLPHQ